MCTLLHHELQDYSLGQIAFTVFQVLFAAALPRKHSACKQALLLCLENLSINHFNYHLNF